MTKARLLNLLKSWAGAVRAALDVRDFLFFGGLALLGYGLGLYAPWLGFAVPGAVLTILGAFVWIIGLFIRPRRA